MPPAIPYGEPKSFIAGDTVKWRRAVPEYSPLDGWVLTYYLRGQGQLDVAATSDESGHLVTIAADQSVKLAPGTYEWIARVELAGEVHTVGTGALSVRANLATAKGGDRVSRARRGYDMVTAVIERRITADVEAYAIDGYQVTKMPIERLLKLQAYYAAQLRRQRNPGTIGRRVEVSFGRE